MRTRLSPCPASSAATKPASRGFSLVEIMVALVIGMIGVIVIMQVARMAEGQKRTTTGAGDTQNNGALAIYSLQRDIKQAGYGIISLGAFGCPLSLPLPSSSPASPPGSHQLAALAPVTINPPAADVVAGDANTDTLLVVYGGSTSSPEGDLVISVFPDGSSQWISVMSPGNFRVDDWVIAAPPAPTSGCELRMGWITAVTGAMITVPDIGATESGRLFNMGTMPRVVAYAIRRGNLTACDYMQGDCGASCVAGNANCNANWTTVATGIVSLRAQYGRDTSTPGDGGIDVWDRQSPTPSPANQEANADQWARISAIRLALVARNSEPERGEITDTPPNWAGSGDAPVVLSPSAADETWKHYRYQVYETVIPLRNIPWMGS